MFTLATPESAGLPSGAVLEFLHRLERENHDPHSLMILRDGKVLAEGWWAPFRRDRIHQLYSLSKSFTSTAVGLAVEEGRLTVEDRVLDFFPDLAPEDPSDHLRAMRVEDLLTMRAGHDQDDRSDMNAEPDGVWMRAFLRRPVPYAPGTHFLYNSSATYALSAILQRITGVTLTDYLRPRLLEPMGIAPARWAKDPRGIDVGGWGLYITTDGIARFGQLLLQRGRWGEQQLVPEAWIERATSPIADNSANENPDWRQGYGYQFWKSRHGFRGDGAFGQFCVVLPERNVVIAMTSASDDLQGILTAVWEELLAPLQDAPLPENPDAVEALRSRMANLAVKIPAGDNAHYDEVFGVQKGEKRLKVGMHGWVASEEAFFDVVPGPIAARGAMQPDGSLVARIQALESTESAIATFRFPFDGTFEYTAHGTWGARQGLLNFAES